MNVNRKNIQLLGNKHKCKNTTITGVETDRMEKVQMRLYEYVSHLVK